MPGSAPYTPPWKLELVHFPWKLLPEIGADLIAVMFVTTITLLLNITSVEISTRREADLDLELKVQGGANLLAAMFGGYISCVTGSRSKLNFDLGATSRVAGVIAASLSLAAVFIDSSVLTYIPKCVLAGLLISMGYDYVERWLVGTARSLARLEYVSLLAIAFIIVVWGFLPGVAIGVIFGCASFAFSAGRINVIKLSFDGSEYRSSLDRGPRELSVLAQHGRQLQGLRLQSYLFFGSANRLYEHVKGLLSERPDCRFLLFDFRLVTGIDSSAVHSFTQIKQAADSVGARLVMVNMPPPLEKIFHNSRFMSKDIMVTPELDRALEICENAIISDHAASTVEVRTLHDWLTEALGSAEMADRLAQDCHRIEFAPGDVVAHQGAAADSMHFIIDGRVGILVDFGDGRSVRVRSLGRQTTIGEMGLLTGRPRSATVQAEVDSIIYELPAHAFARLKAEEPALMQSLLNYVIGVMAERLSFASRVIGVLQR